MRHFIAFASFVWGYLALADQSANGQQNFSATQAVLVSQLHLFVPVSINGAKRTWWLVSDWQVPLFIISPFSREPPAPRPPRRPLTHVTSQPPCWSGSIAFAKSINFNGTELGSGYFRVEQIDRFADEKSNAVSGGFEKGGIMGLNQLLKRGALINYRTFQIFLARDGSRLPLSREGYEKMGYTYVPLRISPKGYVEVEGTIGGSNYSFLMDTGAFVSILEPKIRERNHLAFSATRAILTAPYAGINEVRLTQATVPGFKIGNQDLSDYRIGFAESHTFDPSFLHEYGGIPGPDLLHYHEAIIDLGNQALYLKPDYRSHKR